MPKPPSTDAVPDVLLVLAPDRQMGGASDRLAEVLARARQLVRAGESAEWDGALRYGDLVLDDATRRATLRQRGLSRGCGAR